MKIDSKSLVFGILAGIAIGSIASVLLTQSLQSVFAERYTVTMKIENSEWHFTGYTQYPNGTRINHYENNTRYPYGVVAVFVHSNVTAGEYEIWYAPTTNITLQKGDYTVNLYQGKTGIYIKTIQIYLAKDIEIKV